MLNDHPEITQAQELVSLLSDDDLINGFNIVASDMDYYNKQFPRIDGYGILVVKKLLIMQEIHRRFT